MQALSQLSYTPSYLHLFANNYLRHQRGAILKRVSGIVNDFHEHFYHLSKFIYK